MTRRRKLWLGLLGAVLVLAVGAALGLPALVDLNRYRPLIRERVAAATGLELEIGRIDWSLLPLLRVELEGVAVHDPAQPASALLTASEVRAAIRLRPLLRKEVNVSGVTLVKPQVTLERDRAGVWNWGRAFQQVAEAVSPAVKDGPAAARPAPAGRVLRAGWVAAAAPVPGPGTQVRIARVSLSDGTVRIVDHGLRPGRALTTTLDGVQVELTDLWLDRGLPAAPFGLDLRVNRLTAPEPGFRLQGTVGAVTGAGGVGEAPVDLRLTVEEFQPRDLRAFLFPDPPAFPLPRRVWADLALEGRLAEVLRVTGTLRLGEISGSGPGAPSLPGDLEAELRAVAREWGAVVEVRRLAATLGESRLNLKARVEDRGEPEGSILTLNLEDGRLAFQDLVAGLRLLDLAPPPGLQAQEPIRLWLRLAAPVSDLARAQLSGKVLLSGFSYAYESLQAQGLSARGAFTRDRLHVYDLRGQVGRSAVRAQLELEGLTRPDRDFQVRARCADAVISYDDLAELLALFGRRLPETIRARTPMEVDLAVEGSWQRPEDLRLEGTLGLRDFAFETGLVPKGIREVSADIQFTGKALTVHQFSALIGSTDVEGRLKLRDFAAPRATFAVESRFAHLGELLAIFTAPEPAPAPTPAPAAALPDPVRRSRAQGTIAVTQGGLGTLTFSDFETTIRSRGHQVTFDPLGFALYGGRYAGDFSIDLAGTPAFTLRSAVQGIDLNALLSANTPLADNLFGTVSGDLNLTGTGRDLETVAPALTGTGRLEIRDGRIQGLALLRNLVKIAEFVGAEHITEENTPFQSLTGAFTVRDGRVISRNLRLRSPDLDLKGEGSFTILDGQLDLHGRALFSPEISARLVSEQRGAKYLTDEDTGRIKIPFFLRCTLAEPCFTLDYQGLAEGAVRPRIKEALREKTKELLQDLLGDKD